MIASAWPYAFASLCGAGLAWLVHTRVRGFLPEDPPGLGRKRHLRPTPMLGAWPATLAVVAATLAGGIACAVVIGLAGLTGLADDLRKAHGHDGLDWRWKTLALVLAAGLGAGSLAPSPVPLGATLLVGALLFCTINAVNFLDNQDGVALAVGGVGLAAVALRDRDPLAATCAALWLVMLPLNWPRARVFLGDAGAYALGACLGLFALRPLAQGGAGLLPVLAPLAVPALDFTQVVCVRLVLGRAPWKGDRRHLTHLLLLVGVPRAALAPLLAAVAAAAALADRYCG